LSTNEDGKVTENPLVRRNTLKKEAPDFSGASFVFVIAYAT
jgi:hypothetical protein